MVSIIDVENELFTMVATALRAEYPKIFVTGEYVKAPPSFPCVFFAEMDNTTYRRTQTQDGMENHAYVMYEVDVFSNKSTGKKTECKEIIKVIDDIMLNLGFNRPFLNPILNQDDATIYRMKGRYTAVVSKDNVIYRQ